MCVFHIMLNLNEYMCADIIILIFLVPVYVLY
jgi:hypothetical protein